MSGDPIERLLALQDHQVSPTLVLVALKELARRVKQLEEELERHER